MPIQGESSQPPTGTRSRLVKLRGLVPARFRVLPERLLPRFRRLLLAASLAYLPVAVVAAVSAGARPLGLRVAAVASASWLAWWWVRGRDRDDLPLAVLPVEVAALVALLAVPGSRFDVSGLLFMALAYRASYGSTATAVRTSALFLLGSLTATVLVSEPGGLRPTQLASQLVDVVITVVMVRLVGSTLAKFDLLRARETVLSRARGALVAATGTDVIARAALEAAAGLLETDRGVEFRLVLAGPDGPTVLAPGRDGGGPETVLAPGEAGGPETVRTPGEAGGPETVRTPGEAGGPETVRTPGEAGGPETVPAPGRAGNRSAAAVAPAGPGNPPRWDVAALAGLLEDGSGRATLTVPLRAKDEVKGAILAAHAAPLPDGATGGLEALAAEVALALDNVGLAEDLARREARFRSLVQNASDVICIGDAAGTITYISPAVERVLGEPPERWVGRPGLDAVHPDDLPAAEAALGALLGRAGSTRCARYRIAHADGSWRWLEVTSTNLLHDPGVRGIVANIRDVTERQEFEEQLTRHAFHDPLTGLANRALFRDRIEHALATSALDGDEVAVLMVDLDNFKTVNDSLGHTRGDAVLVEVAGRLTASLRPADTVARLGGDEFAVLLEGAPREEVLATADRVGAALAAPLAVDGTDVPVTASIGVATGARAGHDAEDLLRNAATAMYAAKEAGKARWAEFEPAMRDGITDRLRLETDLRQAIERDELTLLYQPIMTLPGGAMVGVEALVRWRHPTLGLVSPAQFIPLAEETGLIVPVGRWVLREACRQARTWQLRHPTRPPLGLSVNLSARQLRHRGLVAEVAEALDDSGLDARHLVLEITETTLVDSGEEITATLTALRRLGVRFALDDFGTGYSSLSHLHRFPIDVVKIDKSFIDVVTGGPEQTAVARAIIQIGRTLDLETVAEGIEAAEQADRLAELGCQLGQGYHFARPLGPEAISALLDGPLVSGRLQLA